METVTLSDVNVGTIEFDETRGGTTVAKFSVADNHRNRDGEETTAWTRCKAYGYLADMLRDNNAKGRRVSLSGEKEYWTHQDEIYSELKVNSLRFVDAKNKRSGGRSGGRSRNGSGGGSGGGSRSQNRSQKEEDDFVPDDELPF